MCDVMKWTREESKMATTLVYDYERCESDSENDRESVILEFEIEEEYSLSDSASDEEISSVDVDEIRPYMYEPEADSDEENLEDDFQVQAVPVAEGPRGRNQTLDWSVFYGFRKTNVADRLVFANFWYRPVANLASIGLTSRFHAK